MDILNLKYEKARSVRVEALRSSNRILVVVILHSKAVTINYFFRYNSSERNSVYRIYYFLIYNNFLLFSVVFVYVQENYGDYRKMTQNLLLGTVILVPEKNIGDGGRISNIENILGIKYPNFSIKSGI